MNIERTHAFRFNCQLFLKGDKISTQISSSSYRTNFKELRALINQAFRHIAVGYLVIFYAASFIASKNLKKEKNRMSCLWFLYIIHTYIYIYNICILSMYAYIIKLSTDIPNYFEIIFIGMLLTNSKQNTCNFSIKLMHKCAYKSLKMLLAISHICY